MRKFKIDVDNFPDKIRINIKIVVIISTNILNNMFIAKIFLNTIIFCSLSLSN